MPLTPATRLGNYEIVALIGAGGMGEVYRARDLRIGREVAIKVLPEDLLANADRLVRFQREAQSAGSLNHPNLLTIHELGTHDGRTYMVSELLDGVTLRERLSAGALAPRRAIEYATQIAAGLAAAHERGIVHRDLKPENIFITRDGRLKILDFGLAKMSASAPAGMSEAKTATQVAATDPGTVLGTAGYMAPEQVRGEAVDPRADIFALGAILYEMVSGRRAFHGTSAVDTMHAILHTDPPDLASTAAQVPPALERIINHCLEKNPEQRFQSARDLAFDLGAVSGTSGEAAATQRPAMPRALAMWIAAISAVALASWFVSRATLHRVTPRFRRITFQSLPGGPASFSPDQQSVVYSTRAAGNVENVQVSGIGAPETRGLGLPSARVVSVSSRGDLAILLAPHFLGGFTYEGTLARVPLAGGAPREIVEHVQSADWTPSGDDLLVVRNIAGKSRIELPVGNVLYESVGWVQAPRISPDGTMVVWIDHPVFNNDAGAVTLLDIRTKTKTIVSPPYDSLQGVAWDPDGKNIWFTGAPEGNQAALYRTTIHGNPQLVVSAPGTLYVHAVSRDGRVLVSESDIRLKLIVAKTAGTMDRDLSWLDWSLVRDITPDGKSILFDESGEGGGKDFSVYVRPTDGGPAVRLGDGVGMAFSPDLKSVIAIRATQDPQQLVIYSTGAGQPVQVTHDSMRHVNATWVADGKSIAYAASDASHATRLYVQNLSGGAPRPLSPPGVSQPPVCSRDARWIAMNGPEGVPTLYPLQGGAEVKLRELTSDYSCAGWSADSKQLYFVHRNANPAQIVRLDLATHTITPVKEFTIGDSVIGVNGMRMTPDGSTYAYSYMSNRSDLYVIEGLK